MFGRRDNNTNIKITSVTLLVTVASLLVFGNKNTIFAAELVNRSVIIGSSRISALTSNTYNFRVNTGVTVGSIEVEYCTNSPFIGAICTAPNGFSLVSSVVGAQAGMTGFTIHPATTTNRLILTRIPAGVVPPVDASITVNSINNPSTSNETTYVRISTFATTDATGIRGDSGTTAFSTARNLSVGGFVPPFLIFCVGNTVASDCSSTNGNFVSFGDFSTSSTGDVTSQFAVATNDPMGYITAINGLTLTSGNNTIPALPTPSASVIGASQFGINLRQNTTPNIGSDKTGLGTGIVQPDFNSVNNFVFKNANIVVSTLPTEFNVFTVSYIANISSGQSPGVYSATITYVAMVLF